MLMFTNVRDWWGTFGDGAEIWLHLGSGWSVVVVHVQYLCLCQQNQVLWHIVYTLFILRQALLIHSEISLGETEIIFWTSHTRSQACNHCWLTCSSGWFECVGCWFVNCYPIRWCTIPRVLQSIPSVSSPRAASFFPFHSKCLNGNWDVLWDM